MTRIQRATVGIFAAALLTAAASVPAQRTRGVRRISRAALEDKIRGGWAGQMIGVSFGAPTEFHSTGKLIEGPLAWSQDRVSDAIHQDDLYVDMTFAEVMDRVGLDASVEDYAAAFRQSRYSLWHANAAARRLLNKGIHPPESGQPRYNIHANDIDFQIESDFIGLMAPGLPQESNRYCARVGRIMNSGDGLYGGMFISGMYSAAYFERDVQAVVEAGVAAIPAESGYARAIRDALASWHRHPGDWQQAWRDIEERWDKNDSCTDGALRPFNIDARLNGAYVALGLLYGAGDFGKTLDITTRMGQDSDCNPASAGGVLGVMLGYDAIPDAYKGGIPKLADTKFDFTDYSFNDITRSTLTRALKLIARAGGRTTGDDIQVPRQGATPAPLEQWDMGVATARVNADDRAWTFSGDWQTGAAREGAGAPQSKTSTRSGNEATFQFDGTAVALVGPYGQDGGSADVYLDGKQAGTIDAYIPERTFDNDLWHTYGLRAGAHSVRIVTRDRADTRSTGTRFTVELAIVYVGDVQRRPGGSR